MSWLFIGLLAAAVVVLVGAEWPRLTARAGSRARQKRARAKQKEKLRLVKTESDRAREQFAASVQRDLERLPTIEEHDPSR